MNNATAAYLLSKVLPMSGFSIFSIFCDCSRARRPNRGPNHPNRSHHHLLDLTQFPQGHFQEMRQSRRGRRLKHGGVRVGKLYGKSIGIQDKLLLASSLDKKCLRTSAWVSMVNFSSSFTGLIRDEGNWDIMSLDTGLNVVAQSFCL